MKSADTNPDRAIEEILKDIEVQATYGLSKTQGPWVLGPIAALLVKLHRLSTETLLKNISTQQRLIEVLERLGAETKTAIATSVATADKTLKFTKYLFWATIVLLIVTGFLLLVDFTGRS